MSAWRLTCLVLGIFSSSLMGSSQGERPKEARKQDLAIIAILKDPSSCIGAENLHVQVLVTNRGEVAVDLDSSRFSTTAGFVALIDITEMKFRRESLSSNYDPIGPDPAPRLTALRSKEYFEKDIEIPINGPFFSQAGFYRLNLSTSVRVNRATQSSDLFSSNSMIFELRSCESH